MRKALNENPLIQISVLGVGLLLVVVLLFMRMSGGGGEAAPTGTAATATPAPGTTAPVPGATAGTAPTAPGDPVAPAVAGTEPAATGGAIDPQAWQKPGPGLPADVVNAWKRDDAVVLLVYRGPGIDDQLVRGSTAALNSMSKVTLFTTPAEKVARYSRITQAVGLNRVPALVVVRPKDISGSPPQAQVSYGFRNAQSVVQTVRDALYTGKDDVPYYPG